MSPQIVSASNAKSDDKTPKNNLLGLSTAEVLERIAQGRQNITTDKRSKQVNEILAENLFSIFNLIVLLIIGTMLFFYFQTGDIRLPLDAVGVLAIAVINTTLAIVQEVRAKKALDKVNLLLKRTVHVVRDGKRSEIDQSEVVVDDLIFLERGDQLVVDGRVAESNHLEIDESLLTGESVPIEKQAGDAVLSGSFCIAGNGYYVAEKVGDASFAAQITGTARQFKLHLTPLQRQLDFIVKALFVTSIALVLLEVFFGSDNVTNVDFVRKLSTLVISLVPHGLVLMSSITFALGVYRISQLGAIVQKLNAIESFSNVKVVCTDKTGTLTQNKLSIKRVTRIDEHEHTLVEVERLLGLYGELSSDKNATLRTLDKYLPNAAQLLQDHIGVRLVDEVPFSSDLKMSLLEIELNGERQVFVLGGFDVLLDKIGVRGLKGKSERLLLEYELKPYRNLLFGRVLGGTTLAELRNDIQNLRFEPYCIVSIVDEIRPDVFEAIRLFQRHGVELKIMSGDAADSVQAVAHEIGWKIADDKLVTGQQLDAMDDALFAQTVREKAIFARLRPEHKLRLIKSLREQKFYTAMIGDGVNDLPAIKEADLGIAMEEGSAITKEVADIVLLQNKFALLPRIFDEGSRIVNTVSSIAKLFLTKNFFVIYLALAALFFGWAFPLTPRRVSLINIFTIALPSFIIAIKNRDFTKTRNFAFDLFTFVILSGFFVCAAGFAAEFAAENYLAATDGEIQMTMLAVMTITAVANFYAVTLRHKDSWTKTYLVYGLGIIALFVFLATTTLDIFPLDFLKLFYEIQLLDPRFWHIVALISISSAVALFIVQRIRELFIKK
jgi:cation-transporting P-type ATPase E